MNKILFIFFLVMMIQACVLWNSSPDISGDNDKSKLNVQACSEIRIPAEWESHEATWMLWPGRYEAMYREEFAEIIKVLQGYEPVVIGYRNSKLKENALKVLHEHGVPLKNIRFEQILNDNAWMRDNGPVYAVGCGRQWIQDWVFDAWGESEWNNVPLPYETDNRIPRNVGILLDISVDIIGDYILEKGNLESNGAGTVILNWDCQNKRQPEWSKGRTEKRLKEKFGVKQVVWVPTSHPEEFTGGHIDGIARFINEDTVVIPKYSDQALPGVSVFEDAAEAVKASGLKIIRMDVPGTFNFDPKQPGESAVDMDAIYVNWLVGNGVVIATGFGIPQWDASAKKALQGFFPNRDVHMITTPTIWYYGGGVHCVTNDQPAPSIIH